MPPSGIVSKIKNWILVMRNSLKNFAANSDYKSYTKEKHLKKVAKKYSQTTDRTVSPYIGWYNYQIPSINPNIIKKELLSVQGITKVLGEKEQALQEVFSKVDLSSCLVGNRELIRRLELDRFLNQSPINGFKEYPA